MKKPKNENYAATVIEIKTLIPLAGCDNVQAAIIMGNQVVVSKEVKVGDIGLFFPVETALSKEYLSVNNLYRKDLKENIDPEDKGGFFELNGRIRCQKFRGHKSEGLFMPIESLKEFVSKSDYVGFIEMEFKNPFKNLKVGDEFDELEGIEICKKYIPKNTKTPGLPGSKKNKLLKKYESKLVENQFKFHQDTSMLYKNLHRIKPESLISITYKVHGTSGISSYVLCKRNIPKRERIGAFFHNIYTNITTLGKQKFRLETTEYDYLYASRKVIKNEELNPNAQHFYDEDIWKVAHDELKDFLQKGMTFYYEIVGYLPNGGMIQKDYDYGCEAFKGPSLVKDGFVTNGEHKILIYRITYTNTDGKVFEFSARQVQDFCKKNGLIAVPELFYGYAKEFSDERMTEEHWQGKFLETLKLHFNEKDCYMCNNTVPEEGIVVRVEGTDFEAYKLKSNLFYERETMQLDKGESNIEDEN